MASPVQKRVLLGLQAGLKLHEVLREPHMPSQRMVEEWRNAPEFDVEFATACIQGAAYRERQLRHRPIAPVVEPPAPLVVAEAGPLIDEAFRINAALELEPTTPLAIAEPAAPADDERAFKESLMQRLRNGEHSKQMTNNTPGFYAAKLSVWRKDPDFVAEWNQAKAVGHDKRIADAVENSIIQRLTQPAETPESVPTEMPVEAVAPGHEFLPTGPPRHFLVLKAEASYEFLLSEEEARIAASNCTAQSGDAYYICRVVSVAAPITTAVLHPIG